MGDNEVSITITQSYYTRLLQNAWVVERLKKHLKECGDIEFRSRAESLLVGSLKDSLNIKDFGRENNV